MRYFFIIVPLLIFYGCNRPTKQVPAQTQVKNSKPIMAGKSAEAKAVETLELNKTIENIIYDLNNDGRVDSIRLSQDTLTGDSGAFNRLTLSIAGQKPQSFRAKDAWGIIDTNFTNHNKENAIKSDKIYVYQDSSQIVILLFGYVYGAGREETSVIYLKDNVGQLVFDEELEYPLTLTDLDHDGFLDLAGKSHSEMYSSDEKGTILTYDPFFVYTIKGSECNLNIALSKTYNEEFYVWAGLHQTKEIKVMHPRDGGKPKIVE